MATRKRKPKANSETATGPAVETAIPTAAGEPDVFDRAIAERQAVTEPADELLSRRPDAMGADEAPDAKTWAGQPDPFPFLSVALTDANDGPRVRLYRSRRFNQMAIGFDEKPPEPVRQRLRDEGYKWREAEGVWTIQLGEHKASGQLAAERLVVDLANDIRAEAGLPPAGRAVAA
ncbi:MAG: hypothetical protein U0871_25310 [Gemmataceae bacterium]